MEAKKSVSPEKLENQDAYTRLLAVRALGEGALIETYPTGQLLLDGSSTLGATELLLRRLSDEHPLVRAEAASVLGCMLEPGAYRAVDYALEADAVEALCKTLETDPDEDVRITAATALGQVGGIQAEKALDQALDLERDLEVRLEIVRAIGRLPVQEALGVEDGEVDTGPRKLLRQVFESDHDAALRRAAWAQLVRLGDKSVLPPHLV